jgi:hypothetical protein
MRNHSLVRPLVLFALTAMFLAPLACGHDNDRRARECAAKCDEASRACSDHHDKDCGDRAHKCAEECGR